MVAVPGRAKLTAAQLKTLLRRKVGDPDPGLQNVDFLGASLAGCDLRYLDLRSADLTGCDLEAANLQGADLRGALFTTERIRLAANWPLARYTVPGDLGLVPDDDEYLEKKAFESQWLQGVNFTDADLDSYNLDRAHLEGSFFYDASLVGARLEHVDDLAAWQFRGAILTGAHLPEAIRKFEGLKAVEANTKTAARSFTATILACLYCWLTIGTTTDAEFFGAEHATALPFVQTKISPYGFYSVAPLLLAVMFLYLQFSLQQLWEAFASLPAFFNDGRPLHERSAPFFLSAIVRTQFRRLREKAAGLAKWQTKLAWLLGWWVVPLTIALLWWRSLVARLAWLTAIQLFSLGVTVTASLYFISIAGATLRGVPITRFDNWRQWLLRARFPRKFIWAALVTAGLSVFSVRAFRDPLFFRIYADLSYAKLSPTGTVEGGERRANFLIGRNLRGCFAYHADMANVNLHGANLSGCQFGAADLRNADLGDAEMYGAKLDGTNLRDAYIAPRFDSNYGYSAGLAPPFDPRYAYSAGLSGHLYSESDALQVYGFYMGADVQGAWIDPGTSHLSRAIRYANNWILATWPSDTLSKQSLPAYHNERLAHKDLTDYDFKRLGSIHMQHADLKGWILHNCVFTDVDLEGADLSHSDLRDTRFDGARLTNVNFEGADLRGADLSKARGLTQWQLNSAIAGKSDITGKKTILLPGLHGPADR
jgi:uncharacterized protein YjbI with pentapeptide repeats